VKILTTIGFGLIAIQSACAFSAIDSAWNLAADNKIPKALELLQAQQNKGTPADQAISLYSKAQLFEALGQGDSAVASVLAAFHKNPDADGLMFHLSYLLSPIRSQDSSVVTTAWNILHELEQKNPGHPLRAELASELIGTRIGTMPSDSLLQQTDHLGVIRTWLMIGPYENVSNSGMLHRLPPEQGKDWTGSALGLSRMKIHAQAITNSNPDGWLRLDEIQGLPNAVNYFATEIQIEKARNATLNFGVSGTFTVWINGVKILDEHLFRNVGVTGFRVRTALKKGENEVVVKIGNETNIHSNFMVSLADENGLPLHVNAHQPKSVKALGQNAVQTSILIPHAWISNYDLAFQKDPKNFSAGISLARYWIDNDGFEQARPILRSLENNFPKNGLVQSMLGEVYNREDKQSLSDQHYQQALRYDPSLASGWGYEFSRRVAREDWSGAVAWFESRPHTMSPEAGEIFSAIKAYLSLSRDIEAWAWVDTLQHRTTSPDAQIYASSVHMAIGDRKLSVELLERMGKKVLSMPGVLTELLSRYRTLGDMAKAANLLESRLAAQPTSTTEWISLADIRFQVKDWDAVIAAAEHGLAVNPHSAKLLLLEARGLEMRAGKGDADAAAIIYRKALEIPSVDFEVSDRWLELRKEPTLKELRRSWPLDSLVSDAKAWKEAKAYHSVILLSQRSLRWHEWGGVEQYVHLVAEARTAKGVDQWKEMDAWDQFWMGSVVVERAVTHKADGRVIEADVYGTKVVFQGLEPGDRIELEASCHERKEGSVAGQFWAWHYMGHSTPVLHSYFEVFSPLTKDSSFTYKVFQQGTNIQAKQSDINGLRKKVWTSDKVLGSPAEHSMAAWGDVLPKIVVSSAKDWEMISSWYENLSEGKTEASPELRELAAEIFVGAKTDEEKVLRVHEAIVRNVRYSHQPFRQAGYVPQDATKTWLTRIGDCKDMAALGKALLKLAGVSSKLVLLNTNDQERIPTLPMDQFNHCILWVNVDGGRYVDFTADQNGWKALPRTDQRAMSLQIDPEHRDSIANIPFVLEGEYIARETWDTLQANGDMVRHMSTKRGGNYAADFRYDYGQESTARLRDLTMQTLQSQYPGVELERMDPENLDSLQNELRYSTHFKIRRLANVNGNMLVLPLPWSDALDPMDLPGEALRTYPWIAWKNAHFWGVQTQVCHIVLPEGFKLLVTPKPMKFNGIYGTYETTFQLDGRKLLATRTWSPKPFEVTPKEYPKVRTELESLLQADREPLVLVH